MATSNDEYVGTVDASSDPPVGDLARQILERWAVDPIVHVSNLPPRPGLLGFYDALLPLIGTPRAFAEDATVTDRNNQSTGERWMEVRWDPAIPNAYRHSANAQPLHTDGSYISEYPNATIMFCVSAARQGGETVFLPSDRLQDILQRKAPDLANQLSAQPIPHRRSGMERSLPVLREGGQGRLLVNWNFYCVSPEALPHIRRLAKDFFEFLAVDEDVAANCVAVPLKPGEAVMWKDEQVIHGRTAFYCEEVSERFLWKCAVDIGRWD